MYKDESEISCPIFQKQEPIIQGSIGKINNAKEPQEKIECAQDLFQEANVLLSCSSYDERELECKSCRIISNLRKKTAAIILQTQRII